MTYGDKYALLKAYKIQTGDDPDQNASEDLSGVKRGKQTAQPDKTGQPAYPEAEAMVKDISEYIKKHKTANEYITGMMEKAGARDIAELAFTNEALVKACWNKWCNK